MRDLRKQALESHKQLSRKARSRLTSENVTPSGSRATSRNRSSLGTSVISAQPSRIGSRAGSDVEDEYLSEDTSRSGSLSGEDFISMDDVAVASSTLSIRIEEILEWKRSTKDGRELALGRYARALRERYSDEAIRGKETELVISFLKSIKNETTEQEAVYSLQALEMTLITSGLESIYEDAATRVKRTINESESNAVKVACINTLSTLTFYGGASDEDILANMDFFLEIISSDGTSIDAEDAPEPVTAALEGFSFLATLIDDLSAESSDAIEILMDQLGSTSSAVQIGAGEAIALLYEKSYTPPENEENLSDSDNESIVRDDSEKPALVRRYMAFDAHRRLISTLHGLKNVSSRRTGKRDRKAVRFGVRDILNSIENPTHGPRYSTAIDQETDTHYGSRTKVSVSKTGYIQIDKWWQMKRHDALRRTLQGGFLAHYELNPLIFEALPLMVHKKAASTRK